MSEIAETLAEIAETALNCTDPTDPTDPCTIDPEEIWPDAPQEVEEVVIVDDDFITEVTETVDNYDPLGLGRVEDQFRQENTIEEVTEVTPVEPEQEEGGMSTAGKVFLWLFILLCLVPGLLILAVFLTAKFYPKSKVGSKIRLRKAMFDEMMEKR